jgi:hypothetical protein
MNAPRISSFLKKATAPVTAMIVAGGTSLIGSF